MAEQEQPGTEASHRIAVIGGGPAGLYAAECLSAALLARHTGPGPQWSVDVYDAMPSPGRKFLLAGRGGLNLTHSEPLDQFVTRYAPRQDWLEAMVRAFPPQAVRAWAESLGIETFIGTSGRVFPKDFKAAPLMRAWLRRLRTQGVTLHVRHRWAGFAPDAERGGQMGIGLLFETPEGPVRRSADQVLLALGGGSWKRLGSDGAWLPLLEAAGAACAPLRPANCGFLCAWPDVIGERFAGSPLKTIAMRTGAGEPWRKGEAVLCQDGIEGSLVYALSRPLREALDATGQATLFVDLLPDRSAADVLAAVSRSRGSRSWSTHLKKTVGLDGVKLALLRATTPADLWQTNPSQTSAAVAAAIKNLPLMLTGLRPIDEAISTAGGVRQEALTADLELRSLPGVFCAGEMLDWEAPTGGYLLTGCFATARHAAQGMLAALPGIYSD